MRENVHGPPRGSFLPGPYRASVRSGFATWSCVIGKAAGMSRVPSRKNSASSAPVAAAKAIATRTDRHPYEMRFILVFLFA